MKKQSRLAVLLAAVLALATLFTGMAFATATTELNATREDVETALSAEEVQAELVYNQLMECATLKDFFDTLMAEENNVGAWALNEAQLNALYQYIQDMYAAIENPTADDTEYFEMLVETLQVIAEGNGVELLAAYVNQNITSNTTWSLTEDTTIDGVVTISNGATLTINLANNVSQDIVVKRNFWATDASQPMFMVTGNATLRIVGNATNRIILDGNSKNGAAIKLNDGNLDLDYVTIRKMTTDKDSGGGSAVYVTAHRPNTSLGKYNDDNITMDYVNVENCIDTSGNSVLYFYGNVTMNNCRITDCTSDNLYAGVIKGGGGTNYCKLNMNNCYASGNYSSGWGGVILWAVGANGAKATLNGCTFENNSAGYLGGAISVEGKLEINYCKIKNNTAMAGGGIATFPFTLAAGSETNACGLIIGSGNEITGNKSIAEGKFTPFSTGDSAIANPETYPAGGGGIWCYMFQPKTNTGDVWTCSLTVGAGNTITGNTSRTIGGGIALVKEGGGATTLTVNGGTISSNSAPDGAGIGVDNGDFIINGGEVRNNTASEFGGGVYVNNGTFTMNGGSVNSNNAPIGGGTYVGGDGSYTMTAGSVTSNTATTNGGGAYVSGGKFTISGGSMTSNNAVNGAGAYVNGGNFEMSNGSINQNTATSDGGAVYMGGGDFTMLHGEINSNKAVNGGAVYMAGGDSKFKMESGNMNQNTASTDGGAIFANGGTLEIGLFDCRQEDEDGLAACSHHIDDRHHPIMQENTAGQRGGGIAIANDGVVHFYCGAATDNVAMYKGTGKNVFMDGGEFHLYDGANVGVPRDPDLVIVGGTLHNECKDKEYVELWYYQHNTDTVTTMQGLAEYEEVMNLPDGEHFWDAPEGKIFIGWTAQGAASDNQNNEFVRNKEQYVASGEPVQILDARPSEIVDDTDVNTDRIFDGKTGEGEGGKKIMHLYALWAPIENHITYVDGLTRETIVNEAATYTCAKTASSAEINAVTKPGYTLDGWYIYQNEGQNANWSPSAAENDSYEPKYTTAVKHYGNLDLDELLQYVKADEDGTATLNVPALTFGNITLVANWVENVVEIKYQVVGPEGIVVDDPSGDVKIGTDGIQDDMVTEYIGQATGRRYVKSAENVYTLVSNDENDTIQGATAIENAPNYKFDDWYTNEACTTEADDTWIEDEVKLLPQKTIAEGDTNLLYREATYYAKFDFNVADLTIVKKGLNGCDSAIIKVIGYNTASDEEQTWYVSLNSQNGTAVIKDMKIGYEYSIEEVTDWTVYYGTPAVSYEVEYAAGEVITIKPFVVKDGENHNPNTVTITNSPNPDKWLHDENYAINFSNKTPSSGDGK